MGTITMLPPQGWDYVNLAVNDVSAPEASLVRGVSGVKPGDQLVYQKVVNRKEGGTGIVSVGPAGVPSIEGLKGQFVFQFYLVDSADNWRRSEQFATATIGANVLSLTPPEIMEQSKIDNSVTVQVINPENMPVVELYLENILYRTLNPDLLEVTIDELALDTSYSLTGRVGDGYGNWSDLSEPITVTTEMNGYQP